MPEVIHPPYNIDGLAQVERNVYKLGGSNQHVVTVLGALQSNEYTAGSTGWRIDGDGDVEFNSGTFRGTLEAGEIHIPDEVTSSSFHVDTTGAVWIGETTANKATAPFRITAAGAVTATTIDLTGNMTLSTGGSFRTSASGVRFQMSSSGAGVLQAFPASGDYTSQAARLLHQDLTTYSNWLIETGADTGVDQASILLGGGPSAAITFTAANGTFSFSGDGPVTVPSSTGVQFGAGGGSLKQSGGVFEFVLSGADHRFDPGWLDADVELWQNANEMVTSTNVSYYRQTGDKIEVIGHIVANDVGNAGFEILVQNLPIAVNGPGGINGLAGNVFFYKSASINALCWPEAVTSTSFRLYPHSSTTAITDQVAAGLQVRFHVIYQAASTS